jgi:hypothetical protein
MAKKKEKEEAKTEDGWVTVATEKDINEIKAKLEEHQKAIESFRTSFQNFDLKIKNLIERNRLR